MKRKPILPVLAFTIAMVSAFATSPFSQSAFFHVPPNSSALGAINNTDQDCFPGLTTICRINGQTAYSSSLAASNQDLSGVLKYN